MTTISPTPFFVKKTGSFSEWTVSDIEVKLFRKSEIGLIVGIVVSFIYHNTIIIMICQIYFSMILNSLREVMCTFSNIVAR